MHTMFNDLFKFDTLKDLWRIQSLRSNWEHRESRKVCHIKLKKLIKAACFRTDYYNCTEKRLQERNYKVVAIAFFCWKFFELECQIKSLIFLLLNFFVKDIF